MFDPSAPHIIILLVVVLLLFGSRRLPGAARSLGQSMHIFKKSVSGLSTDDDETNRYSANPASPATGTLPPALPSRSETPIAPQDPTQAQLQELQQQVQDLQKQAASGNAGQSSQPF
jgi:sec-independent protein translocase protein TatA